jgi:hypothetical protein
MKIYRFYFTDIDKPIAIESMTKYNARIKLQEIIPQLEAKGYFLENLCRESVEEMLDGVTEKNIKGQKFIWQNNTWTKK